MIFYHGGLPARKDSRVEAFDMIRRVSVVVMLLALLSLCAVATAVDDPKKKAPPPPRRFGFDVDEETFSQQSPEKTMQSIAKALDRKKVDYLLAHIADPAFVDYWVNRYKGDFAQGGEEGKRLLAFERLVTETNQYYANDPLIVRDLRKFAKEAKWAEDGDTAVGTVEGIAGRKVYLRKIGERWFLENKQQ
jgi:hypothetical protein